MALELVPLCTLRVVLEPPIQVGPTPAGVRTIFQVRSGVVEGDRLSGTIAGKANADWLIVGPDGTGMLDVRLLVETADGALVYVEYGGRMDVSESAAAPLYVAPLFQTADPRYAWLNRVQGVGKGVYDGSELVYELYEVR